MSAPYDIELLHKLATDSQAVSERLMDSSDDYASYIGLRAYQMNEDISLWCDLWEERKDAR